MESIYRACFSPIRVLSSYAIHTYELIWRHFHSGGFSCAGNATLRRRSEYEMEPLRRISEARFGAFEVSFDSGELCRDGLRIRVQQQPLKVLQVLLERPGEVVSRRNYATGSGPTRVLATLTKPSTLRSASSAVSWQIPQRIHAIPRLFQNVATGLSPTLRLSILTAGTADWCPHPRNPPLAQLFPTG